MIRIDRLFIKFENEYCSNCKIANLCLDATDCKTYRDYIGNKLGRNQYNQY